jgi:hypothetical protein
MSMDDWLKLSVPVLTGIFALFGSWVGSKLGKATEHHQWLRNQKVEVYSSLLRQVHASNLALNHYKTTGQDLNPDLSDIKDISNARLMVVGSRDVRAQSQQMLTVMQIAGQPENINDTEKFDHWSRRRGEAVAALQAAIRSDLRTEDKIRVPLKVRFGKVVYLFADPFQKWYAKKYGVLWTDRHPTREMKKHMRRIANESVLR